MYPIKVHVWGGLGSQLYAAALAHDLKIRFKRRKIILVLHTGGITLRVDELSEHSIGFEIEHVNDFQANSRNSTPSTILSITFPRSFLNSIRKILRKFLLVFGVVTDSNLSSEFAKIRPWVGQVRGHYSTRNISNETLTWITQLFNSYEFNTNLHGKHFEQNFHAIHYRLGDLLEVAQKPSISESRLERVAAASGILNDQLPILLFSDSPDEATSRIRRLGVTSRIEIMNENAWNSIKIMSMAKTFVGTNSKLSVWVTLTGSTSSPQFSSYIPSEIQHHIYSIESVKRSDQIVIY